MSYAGADQMIGERQEEPREAPEGAPNEDCQGRAGRVDPSCRCGSDHLD